MKSIVYQNFCNRDTINSTKISIIKNKSYIDIVYYQNKKKNNPVKFRRDLYYFDEISLAKILKKQKLLQKLSIYDGVHINKIYIPKTVKNLCVWDLSDGNPSCDPKKTYLHTTIQNIIFSGFYSTSLRYLNLTSFTIELNNLAEYHILSKIPRSRRIDIDSIGYDANIELRHDVEVLSVNPCCQLRFDFSNFHNLIELNINWKNIQTCDQTINYIDLLPITLQKLIIDFGLCEMTQPIDFSQFINLSWLDCRNMGNQLILPVNLNFLSIDSYIYPNFLIGNIPSKLQKMEIFVQKKHVQMKCKEFFMPIDKVKKWIDNKFIIDPIFAIDKTTFLPIYKIIINEMKHDILSINIAL